MKWSEIKPKPLSELKRDLAAVQSRLVDLRFKVRSGAERKVHEVKKARKEASRILTRMHQLRHTSHSSSAPITEA